MLAFGSVVVWVALDVRQPFAIDFGPLWVGAKCAFTAPDLLYDFNYVTRAQAWLPSLEQQFGLRPFVYPPSALLVLAPFGLLPFWWAYGLWTLLTSTFFLWAIHRAGAPWWTPLFPAVALVAAVGQVTFLVGGLILFGLIHRDRQILAGLLFGLAAAIKPQLLLFLPLAAAADRRWLTLVTACAVGAGVCGIATLLFGIKPWLSWVGAINEFGQLIFANKGLLKRTATPYAALVRLGFDGSWAYALAPIAGLIVWLTFRRAGDVSHRLIALVGAGVLVSPYAMNYELALFAPAVATMARRASTRTWPIYLALAFFYGLAFTTGPLMLAVLLATSIVALAKHPATSGIQSQEGG